MNTGAPARGSAGAALGIDGSAAGGGDKGVDGSAASGAVQRTNAGAGGDEGVEAPRQHQAETIISVGAAVTMSPLRQYYSPNLQGGTFYVIAVNNDGTFDVQYVIDNCYECNVDQDCIVSD